MKQFESVLASVLILSIVTLVAPTSVNAETIVQPTATTEAVTVTATATAKYMSFSELNRRVIANYTMIDDLKDTKQTLLNGINALDNPYISMGGRGLAYGSPGAKEGLYYQFAETAFVKQEQLVASLAEVEMNISKIESTLSYTLQKNLMDIGLYQDQIGIYEKKIETLQKKYDNMKLKYEKGTVSKIQLEGTAYELRLTQIATEKMNWQVKVYKANIAKLGALPSGITYDFEIPVDSVGTYEKAQMSSYFETAKSSSLILGMQNAKVASLENEKKYVELYKAFILKSDVLDFQRRVEAQAITSEVEVTKLHRNLEDLLNQIEDYKAEVAVSQQKLELEEFNYRIAQTKVENKSMIQSDLLDYELAVNAAQLALLQNKASRNALIKRTDSLINAGVYIEGGAQ